MESGPCLPRICCSHTRLIRWSLCYSLHTISFFSVFSLLHCASSLAPVQIFAGTTKRIPPRPHSLSAVRFSPSVHSYSVRASVVRAALRPLTPGSPPSTYVVLPFVVFLLVVTIQIMFFPNLLFYVASRRPLPATGPLVFRPLFFCACFSVLLLLGSRPFGAHGSLHLGHSVSRFR